MSAEATYYVQLQAKRHLALMVDPVGDDFPVCAEWLGALDRREFLAGFRALREVMLDYYRLAWEDPAALALPLVPLEGNRAYDGEARDSEKALLWLSSVLFALGIAGEATGGALSVDQAAFQAALKAHYHKRLPLQIAYLSDHGFVFPEWNGKSFPKKGERFTVEFPDEPAALAVLRAAARKVAAIEGNPAAPQRFDFHRITQFPHLLPSLFADASAVEPAYDDAYFTAALGAARRVAEGSGADGDPATAAETVAFYREMMAFFRSRGLEIEYSGDFQKNRLFDARGKDTLNHFEFTDYRYGTRGESRLMLRLKLNHPQAYIGVVESLPSELKGSFEGVWCGHCAEKCGRRVTYTLDGVAKECCGCFGFQFWWTDRKFAPLYQRLFDLEAAARGPATGARQAAK